MDSLPSDQEIMKLVNLANLEDKKALFAVHNLETISERSANRALLNKFEAMSSLEQVRFLSELPSRRKLFAAFQKLNR